MTLQATNPPPRNPSGYRRTAEFWVYFACILVIALPFCCVGWLRDVLRRQTFRLPGPLARAWAEADRTTPLIFSV
ncbi:cytochrome PufQ [Marinibacterium profundimaris]|uniref:Protein pufQ n=1 Tax=Marinibacterium profundimaris TaxID=1679460 RepID=A0A225NJ57_9RHOB|nr:cytochrome PufQ [Marinibacterium profundimaris]OWU72201.1 protein pufQ [Marinibacterium profundimaris]